MEGGDRKKLDISSTAVEKGIDIAKDFADRLVVPPIEELGLLMKDQIAYWRFHNQVKILTKAKSLCEKNEVSIKAVSPKLLFPYLENASLEGDEELQEKWAILLMNMADSDQNVQNHVFPYILGQISKEEFRVLEAAADKRRERNEQLKAELDW